MGTPAKHGKGKTNLIAFALKKEKVVFEESLALELIHKFGLSQKTLLVWKTRGSIPKRYLQTGYSIPVRISSIRDKKLQKDIISVLKNEALHKTNICKITGIRQYQIHDVGKEKLDFSENELMLLKKTLNELKVLIKNPLQKLSRQENFSSKDKKNLHEILMDPRLRPYVILKGCDKKLLSRFHTRKAKKSQMEMENWEASMIQNRLQILLLEISIVFSE